MQIAYFDCFSGISGDMVLGALVDLGVPVETLAAEMKKLPLENWSMESRRERRGAIEGVRVMISAHDQPHRKYSDIKTMLEGSALDAGVKEKSLAVFQRIAEAEGRVHGIPPEDVHFHEVGAVDSILDIAGAVFCLAYLGIERVFASPLPMGRGFVKTLHGTIPLPAPATSALLAGVPVYGVPVERELVTPTGAALLAVLAESFGAIPSMKVLSTGYGVGAHPAADPPNLLRLFLGEISPDQLVRDLLVIETNIDDMNPEFYDHIMEKLFASGALDVSLAPVQMKKNRPGVLLRVLAAPILEQVISNILFTESTTLGIRSHGVKRIEIPREEAFIMTSFGRCRVKRVMLPDGAVRLIPEYEECRRIAGETGVPILEVYREIAGASGDEQGHTTI